MGQPKSLTAYLKMRPFPFPFVGDPERQTYRQFSLESTTLGALFRPGVIARYLGWMVRGWRPRRATEGEDVLQLGGDFILDEQQRLLYIFRSREPTHRPPAAELIRALGG
jgi:hypothetical protein